MKKIYILNPDKKNGAGSKFSIYRINKLKKEFPLETIDDGNLLIDLKKNKSLLINRNKIINPSDSFLFINDRKMNNDNENYFVALVCELFTKKKNKISNTGFTYTKGYTEKIHQMIRFNNNNIPVPRTIITTIRGFTENKKYIENNTSYPCVFKINGANGKAVWKINSKKELEAKVKEMGNEVFMLQEFIPNSFDVRIIVFGTKIIASIKRESADGFKNNLSQGGRGTTFNLNKEQENLAKRVLKVNNALFGGVDMVFRPKSKKPVIFEVNRRPAGMHPKSGFMKKSNLSINTEKIIFEEIIKNYL